MLSNPLGGEGGESEPQTRAHVQLKLRTLGLPCRVSASVGGADAAGWGPRVEDQWVAELRVQRGCMDFS